MSEKPDAFPLVLVFLLLLVLASAANAVAAGDFPRGF